MTSEALTSEREEIEALLPWFVRGTLAAGDRARVESYLARHPDMRFQLDLVREEMDETVAANEAVAAAPAGALSRLMASVEAERTTTARSVMGVVGERAQAGARSVWSQLGDLFTMPTPAAVRWAGAAAALVIVLQAVALGSLVGGRAPARTGYETASGPGGTSVAAGTRVLVIFKPTATAGAIASFLGDIGAEVVAGPKPGGAFIVRVSDKHLAPDQKTAMMSQIKAKADLVIAVLPTE